MLRTKFVGQPYHNVHCDNIQSAIVEFDKTLFHIDEDILARHSVLFDRLLRNKYTAASKRRITRGSLTITLKISNQKPLIKIEQLSTDKHLPESEQRSVVTKMHFSVLFNCLVSQIPSVNHMNVPLGSVIFPLHVAAVALDCRGIVTLVQDYIGGLFPSDFSDLGQTGTNHPKITLALAHHFNVDKILARACYDLARAPPQNVTHPLNVPSYVQFTFPNVPGYPPGLVETIPLPLLHPYTRQLISDIREEIATALWPNIINAISGLSCRTTNCGCLQNNRAQLLRSFYNARIKYPYDPILALKLAAYATNVKSYAKCAGAQDVLIDRLKRKEIKIIKGVKLKIDRAKGPPRD